MAECPPARELCAAGARRRGDPLFGTASRVDLWLLLEVPGAWPDEVGESLDPKSPAGRALLPVLRSVPRSRLLFIKGSSPRSDEGAAFYMAITDEVSPRLYRFELESPAALLQLDLFAVLAEDELYDAHREPRPLYLVCTHGTHDRCCAKFGFPLYRHLEAQVPGSVWQSSHVGGDRFAGNLVCLPHGLYYGHVEPADADAILESTAQGKLQLLSLRGRSCYPMPVQAAEQFLRVAQGETAIDAYQLLSHCKAGTAMDVEFLAAGERRHVLRVESTLLEGLRLLTCDSSEPKSAATYRLLDYRELPHASEIYAYGLGEYRLRRAAMRDYGFIFRLRRETLTGYLDEMAVPVEERGPFFARFDVCRHRVVTVGEEPVGAVSVVRREDSFHLANLHLLPTCQRRGLGTAIVRGLQEQAAAASVPLTTQVLKVNPALAFYERLGFRIEGEAGPRYRMAWQAPQEG